jgi:nickel/cobalt transporter (NiCoT) family protein
MLNLLPQAFGDRSGNLRGRLIGLYAVLVVANIAVWVWAIYALRGHPVMLGTALLAYSFGLRHAVDADHIAAIDNVTRKLMQEGKRPISVGFWFAIGHSAVVILLAPAIAVTTGALASRSDSLESIGNIVGTLISMLFLFLIAAMNVVILFGIGKAFRKARRGSAFAEQDFDLLLNNRGVLARLFRPIFRIISRSWHMLPLGFLFGLGFDTATEVGLLGISATQAGQGMSIWVIMMLPALFAAGMSLIDSTDGVLMVGAYNWAFMQPIRKLYYNLVITAVSVAVAVLIGCIEGLGLIGDQLGLEGRFWTIVDTLNNNFNSIGFVIIGVFIFAWLASVIYYRYARLGDHYADYNHLNHLEPLYRQQQSLFAVGPANERRVRRRPRLYCGFRRAGSQSDPVARLPTTSLGISQAHHQITKIASHDRLLAGSPTPTRGDEKR